MHESERDMHDMKAVKKTRTDNLSLVAGILNFWLVEDGIRIFLNQTCIVSKFNLEKWSAEFSIGAKPDPKDKDNLEFLARKN